MFSSFFETSSQRVQPHGSLLSTGNSHQLQCFKLYLKDAQIGDVDSIIIEQQNLQNTPFCQCTAFTSKEIVIVCFVLHYTGE